VQLGSTIENVDGIKAPMFDGTQPCAYVDPEMFFPEPEEPNFYRKQRDAKAICQECAFVYPCLEYALENYPLGIWGGTTYSERKRLRSLRK